MKAAPIKTSILRAISAKPDKVWLPTHDGDFYRRMMAPKPTDLQMGDRVVHEKRGAGTFEHYTIGRKDCFVKFDGMDFSERVTSEMVSLAPKKA